jgi:hypothetical protein
MWRIGMQPTFSGVDKVFMQSGSEPMSTYKFRHYVVLNATRHPKLREDYYKGDFGAVANHIAEQAFRAKKPEHFTVTALPSNHIGQAVEKPTREVPREIVALVVALEIDHRETVHDLIRVANDRTRFSEFLGSGADMPFAGADHWCPNEAADPIFTNRTAAELLIGVDYLKLKNGTAHNGKPVVTSGQGVQVVIVDQGLDNDAIPPKNRGSGWPVHGKLPGSTKGKPYHAGRTHGMMIAQNILAVAPEVKLFDLPMVPWKISDIQDFFLSTANAAYLQMLGDIRSYQAGQYPGPWIIVNPWAIFDTRSEYPKRNYTDDPTHPFNILTMGLVSNNIDVVFAAGNCGQFCPDWRCGPNDIGPGRDLLGANSLDQVLTVGAVRTDTMWLGYSSQGPGQPRLDTKKQKPDLCASSQFCETYDAFTVNTGTSAATALTAGVVAAFRSTWTDTAAVKPGDLKDVLKQTARKPHGSYAQDRFGQGILDAEAALDKALATFPIP